MIRSTPGAVSMAARIFAISPVVLLADQEASHLDDEDDGDDAQQYADGQ